MTTTKANPEAEAGAPVVISGTIDARQLTNRLKLLSRYAKRNPRDVPILQCAGIEFDGLGVRAKVSHSGIWQKLSANVDGTGTGSIFVPLRTLAAFMSSVDGDTVSIDKAATDTHAVITCGTFSMRVVPIVAEPPSIWQPDIYACALALGEGEMKHLLDMTAPFISKEETRYYLNGVAFEIGETTLRAVATDGHRLGTRVINTAAPGDAFPYKLIVHNDTVDAMRGIIGGSECVARFHAELLTPEAPKAAPSIEKKPFWSRQRVSFSSKDWDIVARAIDGTFPDYTRVIPQTKPETTFITIEAKDIARMSKMMKPWDQRAVKMSRVHDAAISMEAKSADYGVISGEMKADCPDDFKPFGFNIHSLSGIAATLGGGAVQIAYIDPSDPGGPFIISKRADKSAFAILMPMRI